MIARWVRGNEGDGAEAIFEPIEPYELSFVRVNVQERFYSKLAELEEKRKIIGEEFIRVFEEAKKIGALDFLVQGTTYLDVIESGLGKSAVIKSHNNVVGLLDCVDFKRIIEPLQLLFKDKVRKVGRELSAPKFNEWKLLECPEVKIANRNMFCDENGKHIRTKRDTR